MDFFLLALYIHGASTM